MGSDSIDAWSVGPLTRKRSGKLARQRGIGFEQGEIRLYRRAVGAALDLPEEKGCNGGAPNPLLGRRTQCGCSCFIHEFRRHRVLWRRWLYDKHRPWPTERAVCKPGSGDLFR